MDHFALTERAPGNIVITRYGAAVVTFLGADTAPDAQAWLARARKAVATAADWHGGQTCPLYAFASSGTILETLVPELERMVRESRGGPHESELHDLLSFARENEIVLAPHPWSAIV